MTEQHSVENAALDRVALRQEILSRYRGPAVNETGLTTTVGIALDVFAEFLAAPVHDAPDRDHCPTCGAQGADHCASRTGRDHPTRRVWARAYMAGVTAARQALTRTSTPPGSEA